MSRSARAVAIDLMTSPARTAPATWEWLKIFYGQSDVGTVLDVLFDPDAAPPAALRQLSDRYWPGSPGWLKFLIDTGTHPANFAGLGFARGAGAMRFHGNPSAVAKIHAQDFNSLSTWFQPFNKLLRKIGLPISSQADKIANVRMSVITKEYMNKFEDIRKMFPTTAAWRASMPKIALRGMGVTSVKLNGLEQKALSRMHTDVFEGLWPMISSIEEISVVKGAHELIATPHQAGYFGDYMMQMLNPSGMLLMKKGNQLQALKNSKHFKQLVSTGEIEGMPFDADSALSLFQQKDRLLRWLNQPGAAKMTNSFRLQRKMKSFPEGFDPEKHFMLDLDKMIPLYIHKAARTNAMNTPLLVDEALILHPHLGAKIIANAVDITELPRLQIALRNEIMKGSAGNQQAVKTQIANFYERLAKSPEQRSVGVQVMKEAAETFKGYNPLSAGIYQGEIQALASSNLSTNTRVFHEWLQIMYGKRDLEGVSLARGMSGVLQKLGNTLDEAVVGKPIKGFLDKTGNVLLKNPRMGKDIKDWLMRNADSYNTQAMERQLTNFVYSTTLGFRLPAVLVQLTQTPVITAPTIGFGNTLAGAVEGVPKLAKAYVHAFKVMAASRKSGSPVSHHSAIQEGIKKHLPDFSEMGLTGDFRSIELGMDRTLNAVSQGAVGVNARISQFIDASLLPFEAGETMNRVIAFYGSKNMFRNTAKFNPKVFGYDLNLLSPKDRNTMFNRQATEVVYDTQFVPSAGRMSRIQAHVSPALRQFTTYPISFSNWLLDASLRGAIDTHASSINGMLHRHFGTNRLLRAGQTPWGAISQFGLPYARYLAATSGVVNFGHNVMGIDLAEKVLGGAINLPFESSPFSPLPLGPIPSLGANLVGATLTGNWDTLGLMQIPYVGAIPWPKTVFPAGLAISHAAKALNNTKDGVYLDRRDRGMYNVDNKLFWMRMLGFVPQETVRDDMKVRRLLRTQTEIKGFRHRMAVSIANGDMKGMMQARQEYGEQFKDMPALVVSPRDIRRIISQQKMTKLQRVSKSVMKDAIRHVDPMLDQNGLLEARDAVMSLVPQPQQTPFNRQMFDLVGAR